MSSQPLLSQYLLKKVISRYSSRLLEAVIAKRLLFSPSQDPCCSGGDSGLLKHDVGNSVSTYPESGLEGQLPARDTFTRSMERKRPRPFFSALLPGSVCQLYEVWEGQTEVHCKKGPEHWGLLLKAGCGLEWWQTPVRQGDYSILWELCWPKETSESSPAG